MLSGLGWPSGRDIMASIMSGLDSYFSLGKPDVVIVRGDTTTSTAWAIACFYHGEPLIQVVPASEDHQPNHFPAVDARAPAEQAC